MPKVTSLMLAFYNILDHLNKFVRVKRLEKNGSYPHILGQLGNSRFYAASNHNDWHARCKFQSFLGERESIQPRQIQIGDH